MATAMSIILSLRYFIESSLVSPAARPSFTGPVGFAPPPLDGFTFFGGSFLSRCCGTSCKIPYPVLPNVPPLTSLQQDDHCCRLLLTYLEDTDTSAPQLGNVDPGTIIHGQFSRSDEISGSRAPEPELGEKTEVLVKNNDHTPERIGNQIMTRGVRNDTGRDAESSRSASALAKGPHGPVRGNNIGPGNGRDREKHIPLSVHVEADNAGISPLIFFKPADGGDVIARLKIAGNVRYNDPHQAQRYQVEESFPVDHPVRRKSRLTGRKVLKLYPRYRLSPKITEGDHRRGPLIRKDKDISVIVNRHISGRTDIRIIAKTVDLHAPLIKYAYGAAGYHIDLVFFPIDRDP